MFEVIIYNGNQESDYINDILRKVLHNLEIKYNVQLYKSLDEMLHCMTRADVAILDVIMEDAKNKDGIAVGKYISSIFPGIKLIYVTSFQEYSIQAVNRAHAFSFLLKPLKKEELWEQILDVIKELNYRKSMREKVFCNVTDESEQEISAVRLILKDIIYFEYIKSLRKVKIVLENKTYQTPYVMERLEEELEDSDFAVNNRGQMVNLAHIKKIKGYDIYLDNGQTIRLSQKRAVEFRKTWNKYLDFHEQPIL